jgi:hypothetical protein
LATYNGTAESSTWRAANPVDLSAYAGKSVQLRWYFDTLDPILNNFEGWYVDDVKIDAAPLHDDYSFALGAGDSVTIGVTALSPGGVDVSILDGSGNVVATSQAGPTNVTQVINNFVAPASGTYYLQVAGRPGTRYSMVATRNADFSLAPNSSIATAQPVLAPQEAGRQWVLGSVGQLDTQTLTFDELPFQPVDGLHFKGVTFGFTINGVHSTDAHYDAFGPGVTTYTSDPSLEGNASGVLTLDFDQPRTFVQFGVALSTNATLPSGATVKLYDPSSALIGVFPVSTSPGGFFFTSGQFSYSGSLVSRAVVSFDSTAASRFVVDNLVTGIPHKEFYKVSADGNSMLQIDTGIPAYGSGQFVNNLVSGLKLYDPSGNLVATASGSPGDGTASLQYKVPKDAGGTYYIEVDALGSTQGEYILSIKGASSPSTSASTDALPAASMTPVPGSAAPATATAATTTPLATPAAIPADTVTNPLATPAAIPADTVVPVPVVSSLPPAPAPASTPSGNQAPMDASAVDQALMALNPPNQDTTDLAWDVLLSRKRLWF